MLPPYPIIDISNFQFSDNEQLGSKKKSWFIDPDGNEFLFKSIMSLDKNNIVQKREGEDWAEKITSELANVLQLPSAQYDLAIYKGERGVISKNFLREACDNPDEYELIQLILGNELIENPQRHYKNQPISRVHGVMRQIIKNKPLKHDSFTNIKKASDFFTGYLMFDVLISNQDRHCENWGLIQTAQGTNHLAPSFDHAASLGRSENSSKRKRILYGNDPRITMEKYVTKAKSYFSRNNIRCTLMEAYLYFAQKNKKAAIAWGEKLNAININTIKNIVMRVPQSIMDDLEKEFTIELLRTNKARILKEIEYL
ncbi:HipA domain-containing protein [Ignatzschineria cameli]|uniref:HipA domain-containing protein n=1 Tax=Ignatzschineria cameli TaxID=2182793 RepID=UPI000D610821|nr:HipA domain-containing protein [Ignatzschineria cameli]PWD83756.1 hypothetical protein DC080_07740 [Ignatzschineria cameli]